MVAVALHTELSSIEHTLLENANRLTEKPPEEGSGFLVPDVMHSSLVLKDMLSKVGLLDPATTRKVMNSYILLGQYFEGLILVGEVVSAELATGASARFATDRHDVICHLSTTEPEPVSIDALAPYLK